MRKTLVERGFRVITPTLLNATRVNVSADDLNEQADLGNASAMFVRGVCYYDGEGVSQDYKEAVKWYRKSADLGDATAMNNPGGCYEDILGVPQDYIMAHMWYNVAFAHGETLGGANRDRLARIMAPSQIERAQDMASKKHKNSQS